MPSSRRGARGPLEGVRFLILDARYEKVRHGGVVIDCAVLIAFGVRLDGKRTILGVSASLSEAEVHWRDILESLQQRGCTGAGRTCVPSPCSTAMPATGPRRRP